MELLAQFIDVFLHVDDHLLRLINEYGSWIYAILFVIIFCETGLVVTPFLPGDSLLFAAGALAASASATGSDGLSVIVLMPLLIVAAILGDAVNYSVGRNIFGKAWLDKRLQEPEGQKFRIIKRKYLEKTQTFYDKYGAKTIVLARFVPIVRTFAPFVAGIGKMTYPKFAMYNVVGACAWVIICVMAGFFFGELPFVKKNFELVILGIIFVSVLPIIVELTKAWLEERRTRRASGA